MVFNGIDRVDNTKGYTLENCVPCCTRCNLAKHTMSLTAFKEWVAEVFTHMNLATRRAECVVPTVDYTTV
jgi:hypothetical protein